MSVPRLDRVNSLVLREIAEAVPSVMASSGIDLASVTVTGVSVAGNLRNATVSVSVLGHEGERDGIVAAFQARGFEFQRLINRDVRLKYTPVLRFVLDESIEKGDHVLDVLDKMERSGELPSRRPPPGE